jgi:hypothetical protein
MQAEAIHSPMLLSISNELVKPLPLSGNSPALSLWIHKTANVFRGVIDLECTAKHPAEAATLVREVVAAEYKPGRIVPFAFGTVLRCKDHVFDSFALEPFIADTAQSKGTWQWSISVNEESRKVHGVHMWMRGYLTPVYEEIMGQFELNGYTCSTRTKEPSRLWVRMWNATKTLLQVREFLIMLGVVIALAASVSAFFQ